MLTERRQLTIVANGGLEVMGPLLCYRANGQILHEGVNQCLRERHPGWVARVKHHVFTRSDALLAAEGTVPEELVDLDLPLGPYSLADQFRPRLFSERGQVAIVSILPDVMNTLAVHRREGYLFYPYGFDTWTDRQRTWLARTCHRVPALTPYQSVDNLKQIVKRLTTTFDHVIIMNVSSYPMTGISPKGIGLRQSYFMRALTFNVLLYQELANLGAVLWDCERIFAWHGVRQMKVDSQRCTAEGAAALSEDFVDLLEEIEVFA
jgi:hypothetical protein